MVAPMNPSGILVFDLAERRLAWAGRRQEVLAQNIANADTPAWPSRDVAPFASQLNRVGTPSRTDPGHQAPHLARAARIVRAPGERAPNGNAVALDVELSKVADTESVHALATGLFGKYLALFRTAAGR
jgi:flagellar basal-body rod protein FlgB